MERISALIEKLRGQFAAGADIEQLLLTTQLLEGELRYHRQKGTVPASPHVAVLMPNGGNRLAQRQEAGGQAEAAAAAQAPAVAAQSAAGAASAPSAPSAASAASVASAASAPSAPSAASAASVASAASAPNAASASGAQRTGVSNPEHERYLPHNGSYPSHNDTPVEKEVQKEVVSAPAPSREKAREQEPVAFNPMKDVPTLTHQIPQETRNKEAKKELNEAIARENGRSLNDTLKGQQRELSAVLTEAPIRDLRKAIGINDRYVFISELFRGDEIMYERSVKTINNFSIYQEAYYWMERELKLKLAWDEDRKSTQLFYQLVRRRFS